MKRIHVIFENEEFEIIKARKGTETWRDYIVRLSKEDKENGL